MARTSEVGVPAVATARRASRKSPLSGGTATPPTPADTPKEHVSLGDQPVAASPEDADAAFRNLYAEHGPALLRLTTTLTGGDRGRAEDLVQETMVRAWIHRNNFDFEHRSPRAWLMTTARRLAIDAYRARRARPQETELSEDVELAGGQRAGASVDDVGVRAALAALPRNQRQVLAEIYYRDQSVAETARLLQIPPGTVRSRTFYGVRALRRALAAHDAAA